MQVSLQNQGLIVRSDGHCDFQLFEARSDWERSSFVFANVDLVGLLHQDATALWEYIQIHRPVPLSEERLSICHLLFALCVESNTA